MLIAAIVVGALTAWFFGLRAGLWATAGTAVACAVALVMPRYAVWIYVALAAAVVLISIAGAKRARPTSTVVASKWVWHRARKVYSRFAGKDEDQRRQKRR